MNARVPFVRHLVAFGCTLWVALFWTQQRIVDWAIADDAYFTFGIARNLVQGHGSTFDRLQVTNDFQPLWFGISTIPYYLNLDDVAAVAFLMSVQMLAIAIALSLGIRIIERNAERRTSDPTLQRRAAFIASLAMVVFALSPWAITVLASGTEWALALAVFVAIVDRLDAGRIVEDVDRRALAALLALLVLVRLDGILFLPWLVFVGRARGWTRREMVDVAMAPLFVFCVWAGLELWWFRIPLPVGRPFVLASVRTGIAGGALVATIALVALLEKRRGFVREASAALGFAVTLAVLQKALRPYVEPWQLSIVCFFVVLSAATMVVDLAVFTARIPRLLAAAIVLAAIGVFARGVKDLLTPSEMSVNETTREAALWMKKNFALSGVVGAKRAGALGYWSHRRVLSLDGAATSIEYERALRRHRTTEWLDAQRVSIDYTALLTFDEDGGASNAKDMAAERFGSNRTRVFAFVHFWRFWYNGRAEGKSRASRMMTLWLARLD